MKIKGNMTIAILAAMIGVPAVMMNHASAHADTTNGQSNGQVTDQSQNSTGAQLVNDAANRNGATTQDRIASNADHLQSNRGQNDRTAQPSDNAQPEHRSTEPATAEQPAKQSTQPSTSKINDDTNQLIDQIMKSGNRLAQRSTVRHHAKKANARRHRSDVGQLTGSQTVTPARRMITQPTTSVNDAIQQAYRSELAGESTQRQQSTTPAQVTNAQSQSTPNVTATEPSVTDQQPAASVASTSPEAIKRHRAIKHHRHAKAAPKKRRAGVMAVPKKQTHQAKPTGASGKDEKVMASLAVLIAVAGIGYATVASWNKRRWNKRLQRASSEAVARNRQFQMDNDNMDLVSNFDRAFIAYANRLQNAKPKKPFHVKKNSSVADTFDQALDAYANNL